MVPFRTALFDRKFDHYITKRVSSVLWLISMVLIIAAGVVGFLACIGFFFYSISSQQLGYGVLMLLLAIVVLPLAVILTLIMVRMGFESSIALVAIAENTRRESATYSALQASTSSSDNSWARKPSVDTNKFTAEEIDAMMDDFDATPNAFASDVLGPLDHKKWVRAGKPDLKPWLQLGLPDFELWLTTRKK
jgi:uncharacterized membrane protein